MSDVGAVSAMLPTHLKGMKTLYFTKFGGPEVLTYGTVPDPVLTPKAILVQTTYIGLNFADIYRRRGQYHLEAHRPFINGYEGIGRVVATGTVVTGWPIGMRVLFVDVPLANAERVVVPVEHAIPVPEALSDVEAVSVGLQGLTADFLIHDLAQAQVGKKVLVHGIAGGVGQLLTQMLVATGAKVYGVASTKAKAAVATANGATAIFDRHEDWPATHHDFFDTVYDGVGTTLTTSIAVTKPTGRVVFYGMAGGDAAAVEPMALLAHSKSLMTGDLWDYLTSSEERTRRARRVFHAVMTKQITVAAPTIFPLADGAAAHRYLETGRTTGKVLLRPDFQPKS